MPRGFMLILGVIVLGTIAAFVAGGTLQVAAPPPPAPGIAAPPAEQRPVEVSLAAVGDFLMHLPVVNSTRDAATGAYDFDSLFTDVHPLLAGADYTAANLETRLAGPGPGYQGYPLFNTPDDLAPAMRRLGIDLVTTANNHSMDMGWRGIVATLDCLDRAGVAHVGTYRSAAEREKPFVVEVRGVRLGILNYTATTNGLPLPAEHPYAVANLEEQQVSADLARLRALDPDLIIAFVHWGTEYRRGPDPQQREWADKLARMGVDLIIGQHPHVVQPIERLDLRTADDRARTCFVVYSLGNFISNQRWRYSDSGIILHVGVTRDPARDVAEVTSVSYTPVWVDTFTAAGRRHYRVLPVPKALADYEAGLDGLLTAEDYQRLQEVRRELADLLDRPEWGIAPHETTDPAARGSQA
ncbi:MAG: CapA family protein [Bacillota bacterium]|nr:CapA family protein [Bacillota bacterium]